MKQNIPKIQPTRVPPIENIEYATKRYVFTQRALAEYFGVSKQTISKYLKHTAEKYFEAPHLYCDFYGKQRMRKVRYYDLSAMKQLTTMITNLNSEKIADVLKNFNFTSIDNQRIIDHRFAKPEQYIN